MATAVSNRLSQIKSLIERAKQPAFRLEQISKAIYGKGAQKYEAVTGLPTKFRQQLTETLGEDVLTIKPAVLQESKQATKVLFELHDKQKVEAVHMRFEKGKASLCISSQVGCALKCNFCATGAVGFKRQMTADEITDQVLYFTQRRKPIDSISFMGMGEPLQNPKVFDALAMLTDKSLFAFPQRAISVSTVGIIPGIQRLTKEFPQVNLAFSLHSPFEEQRSVLVPANKNFPLREVVKVVEQHALATNRKIFLAYLVLEGFNDSQRHADAVADIIDGMDSNVRHLFHVNLLRYNPAFGIGNDYRQTTEAGIKRFQQMLQDRNVSTTVRQSFGVDIDAACGQLYAKYPPKSKPQARSSPPPTEAPRSKPRAEPPRQTLE